MSIRDNKMLIDDGISVPMQQEQAITKKKKTRNLLTAAAPVLCTGRPTLTRPEG